MKLNKKLASVAIIASLAVLTGCAQSGLSGTSYSRGDARVVQNVQFGSIVSVTPVMIEADGLSGQGLIGAGAGAIIGGILGNKVGGGSGRQIAQVAGAVGGGIAGQHAERAIQKTQGEEITVQLANGSVISVVQAVTPGHSFRPGHQVKVIEAANGVLRVTY